MNFNPIVLALIFCAIVLVVAVLWARRHAGTKLGAEITGFESQASDAAHSLFGKALDVISNLHATIASQAAVIASPPVQAAINAVPPAAAPAATAALPAVASTASAAGAPTSTPAAAAAAVLSLTGAAATAVPGAGAQVAAPLIEPVVPAGTANTVTLPVTGHVLSIAQPPGEMFPGYCRRVSLQAAAGDAVKAKENGNLIGMLFLGTQSVFAPFGGFMADGSNWPQAADRFFNGRAYMTPAELAQADADAAQWAALQTGHAA